MTIRTAAVAALLGLCTATGPGAAQQVDRSTGLGVSRPDLEQLLRRLEQASQARDSSAAARTRARDQAGAVRTRLAQGDFHAGDRVLLRVESSEPPASRATPPAERSVEEQLSDSFTVAPDRSITLPLVGVISLAGVLHAELEAHLTRQLSQFIRDPVVHARPLIRIGIVGAVAKPGFYAVPADVVLSDALMVAGGPAPDAKLGDMRIERAGERLWEGDVLRQAITDGRTLDEMNLRAGDQFIVPMQGPGSTYQTVRIVGILLGIPITIYTLTKILK
jgi:protein involved in polysaccharide export with SLBB domain